MAKLMSCSSDEADLAFCHPCRANGLQSSATKFCKFCEEFLCVSCSKIHAGSKLTKEHVLLNVDEVTSSRKECSIHPGEAIRLFCKSHNELCCLICFTTHHKTCQDTSLIADMTKTFSGNKDFKSFKADLKRIENDKSKQIQILRTNQSKCESDHVKWIKAIEAMAEKAHLRIDQLKENTIKIADQAKYKNNNKLKQISDTLTQLESDLARVIADIEKEEKSKQPDRVFIAWKKSQNKLEQVKTEMSQLKQENFIATLTFDQTEEIETLLNAKSVLGTLSGDQVTLQYVEEVKVKSLTDKKDCRISGIAMLSPSQMVVTDLHNKNAKVIDTIYNKIVQTTQFSVEPTGVTLFDDKKVGVALFKDKLIQLMSADDKLKFDRNITVDAGCLSVCQEQKTDHLIVSHLRQVHMIDMNGVVTRAFTIDSSGRPLFNFAHYLALSPDQSMLYVTDKENHSVTCLALDGDVKHVYRDAELKKPCGIVTDNDGHVLVCSSETHCIHVLTPDCLKLKVIPVSQHRLMFPAAAAFCSATGRLYISSACTNPTHCNSVKVFELK